MGFANHSVVIARHSPQWIGKVGLPIGVLEKRRLEWLAVPSSPVISGPVCRGIIGKYAHFSITFAARGQAFLCNPDCVAERDGFEPSVPL